MNALAEIGARPASKYIQAARVPLSVEPQLFGLWGIERVDVIESGHFLMVGARQQTILRRITEATVHLAVDGRASGEIVMEDSRQELRKHLPIWMHGRGRILITGLGLGCVVRALLIKPDVTHIDVVERDPGILRVLGAEFEAEPRVTMHLGDAHTIHWPHKTMWDFAWHDIWSRGDEEHLTMSHMRLINRYQHMVFNQQGAWELPRWLCKKARHYVTDQDKRDWLLR